MRNEIEKFLGMAVRDRLSGLTGIVVSVSYDVSGCVQGFVRPKNKDNKISEGFWIDTKQLIMLKYPRAMPVPDFGNPPGAQELGRK